MNATDHQAASDVSPELLDAIGSFPVSRDVEHCGTRFAISPFDLYALCPTCGTRIKVRAFGAIPEIEDLFDAFFEWMNRPGAASVAHNRMQMLAEQHD